MDKDSSVMSIEHYFRVIWSLTTFSKHFEINMIAVPFILHDCFGYHSCGLHITQWRYGIRLEFLQIKTVVHKKLAIHVVCLLICSYKTKKKKRTEETLFLNVFLNFQNVHFSFIGSLDALFAADAVRNTSGVMSVWSMCTTAPLSLASDNARGLCVLCHQDHKRHTASSLPWFSPLQEDKSLLFVY